MLRLKVFVSSIQKELQDERAAIGSLLTTDPFLNQCVVPRIFEKYPAPLRPNPEAYLQLLTTCHVYVLIIGNEYGVVRKDGLSATHQEYQLAKERQLPSLICVKSNDDSQREEKTKSFFAGIKADLHTYSRFNSIDELQRIVRERLIEYIQTTFDTLPTPTQNDQAKDLFQIAAPFERRHITHLTWTDLNHDIARQLASNAEEKPPEQLTDDAIREALQSRGYLWFDAMRQMDRPTIAGSVLLANVPSKTLPQARVQMDAFAGTEPDATPLDSVIDDLPLSLIVDRTIAFVRRNTRKPLIIQGARRIARETLPPEAIREAIVNAIAHRDYEVSGAKVVVELFSDRLVVSSPGLPPGNQTIEVISSGTARSRTRNPLIVQGLVFLGFMEERGSGIRRIREAMMKKGLATPSFNLVGDEFTVTLQLPTDELSGESIQTVMGGTDSSLSANEKMVLSFLAEHGPGTTSLCVEHTKLSRGTIVGILKRLVNEGYLKIEGVGRGTKYRHTDYGHKTEIRRN